MIITKTPFRVSFFGGGTDYPEYFEQHGGAVLASSISHSAFLSVSHFYSKLFDYSLRIAYRQVECVNSLEEIQHGAFRECLRRCDVTRDVEVAYTAHLPSFSGLGSSSSFVVGLLNALHAFCGRSVTPLELAYEAIELERCVLKENVGCQDQTLAAVGGLNLVEFHSVTDIRIHPVTLPPERLKLFEQHLMMFHTGIRRRASEVAARQIQKIPQNLEVLHQMRKMVDKAQHCLTGTGNLDEFGTLLDESWRLKQSLDSNIANSAIAEAYAAGKNAGALGGKLLGAGGGGFLLFFTPPERRARVRASLSHLEEIPLTLGSEGSHILYRSSDSTQATAATPQLL
jgi:D-glycero-alpha-D-manno-heptose-7-phosphate kinase